MTGELVIAGIFVAIGFMVGSLVHYRYGVPPEFTRLQIICEYEGGEKMVEVSAKKYCIDKDGQVKPVYMEKGNPK